MKKLLIIAAAVLLISCQAEPEVIVTETIIKVGWMKGEIPYNTPVVGAWSVGAHYVYKTIFRTDHAGIWEFYGFGQKAWPVESPPDFWMHLPGEM